MKKLLIIPLLMFLLQACEQKPVSEEMSDKIVVQAYLYANSPVKNIYLTELLPYGSGSDSIMPINDAIVSLSVNGETFALLPSDSAGYFHYPGNDLNVVNGDSFSLSVSYNGDEATATTIVPGPPENLEISTTEFEYEFSASEPGQPGGNMPNDSSSIKITWQNPANDYFYILIENIDSVQVSFLTGDDDFPGGGMKGRFTRRITEPVIADSYRIRPGELEYYGNYRVKVFRVNSEYVQLYETITQDSRNLTEPASNIINGLGIFTAFNCDSVFFNVIDPDEE